MLKDESRKLINSSTSIGFASSKYPNGWEYFCKCKEDIYYIVDDGTKTEMIAKSTPKKISAEQAIKLLKEAVNDESKLLIALEILGIENGIHIRGRETTDMQAHA